MSYGLLIKDRNNNTIMGPDTFTVRMVDARNSGVGEMIPGQAIRLDMSDKVRSGMFAIVMPLRQYVEGYSQEHENQRYSTASVRSIPYVTVHDGFVYLRSPALTSGRTDGNVAIYIFTNV